MVVVDDGKSANLKPMLVLVLLGHEPGHETLINRGPNNRMFTFSDRPATP